MIKKLKQLFTIAFAFYFLGISMGLSLNLHYCEGEVAGFALLNQKAVCETHSEESCETDHCGVSETQESHFQKSTHHCCTDKSIYVHFDSIPLLSKVKIKIIASEIALLIPCEIVETIQEISEEYSNTEDDNPFSSYPPPFIQFQQFLVYA